MINILLILLGCNIQLLLNSRIINAVNFAKQLNETNVHWFLSGGIKNPLLDEVAESTKMAEQISVYEKLIIPETAGNKWNYIYDTVSTNTAENFIMSNKHINVGNIEYSQVYIATSKFHYNRSNKIAEKIFNKDITLNWLLSDT